MLEKRAECTISEKSFYGQDDPREKAVRDAFYMCLEKTGMAIR
jgi:hypothetical protein